MTTWIYNVEDGSTPPIGGVVALSAEAYARMMQHLLPPGKLWRLDLDSVLSRVLLAASDELARVSQRGADLVEEADPRTTDELLPDFERVLGLGSTGTLTERRSRVIGHLLSRPRFRPSDYQQALAAILGQAPEDVVVIERTRADAVAMADDREIYRYFIYRDPNAPGTYDLESAQALVTAMEPAHVRGHVIESVNMLCDDQHSLCDRDILGV